MSVKGRKPRRFLNVDVFLLSLTKAFLFFQRCEEQIDYFI